MLENLAHRHLKGCPPAVPLVSQLCGPILI